MTKSHKVPFYILGFLIRLGPIHGYQLKIHLEQQAGDFANIKLPNIYYHLGAMKNKGWVQSRSEKGEIHPDKEIFSITDSGRNEFQKLYEQCFRENLSWELPVDGALFFSSGIEREVIFEGLFDLKKAVELKLKDLNFHKEVELNKVPQDARKLADLIFSHHLLHFQIELEWLNKCFEVFNFVKSD